MSSTRNIDSIETGEEFQPRRPRDEPMTTKGHAPGVKVGNDAVPEFTAEVLPAGSAPADRTFQPNPITETPGQANNPDTLRAHAKESTYTDPLDSFGGSTSADVHTGLGHPGQGQTAGDREKKKTGGIVGRMEDGLPGQRVDQRLDETQRGLEREGGGFAGEKGLPGDQSSAEERVPVGAEEVSAERTGRERLDRGT